MTSELLLGIEFLFIGLVSLYTAIFDSQIITASKATLILIKVFGFTVARVIFIFVSISLIVSGLSLLLF
jgi:hypothetical protein